MHADQRVEELRARRDELTPYERGELRALERARGRVAAPPPAASDKYEAGRARARSRFGRSQED